MNKMVSIIALLSVAGVGHELFAEEAPKWEVGGGLVTTAMVSQARQQAGLHNGINLNASRNWYLSTGTAFFRSGVTLTTLGGGGTAGMDVDETVVPGSNLKLQLTYLAITTDLVLPVGQGGLRLITGLSLGRYYYKVSGARPGEYTTYGIDGGGLVNDQRTGDANGSGFVPSFKWGLRAGLEYKIDQHWGAELLLHATEIGRVHGASSTGDTLSPAWLQAGVRYSF